MSRMPVVQALRRLASEGFVTMEAHKPVRVADPSAAEIRERYLVIVALERVCVQEAFARDPEAVIAAPARAGSAGRRPTARRTRAEDDEQDRAFHEVIWHASGLPSVAGMLQDALGSRRLLPVAPVRARRVPGVALGRARRDRRRRGGARRRRGDRAARGAPLARDGAHARDRREAERRRCLSHRHVVTESGAALTLTNVSKRFPGVQALDAVSLTVTPGEIHGLIGENGAGKSTLVNILAGAVAPDGGTIEVRGRPGGEPRPARPRCGSASTSVTRRSVWRRTCRSPRTSCLAGCPRAWARCGVRRRASLASAALEAVGVQIDPRATVGDLSLAHQQMVEIARAVRLATSVLVLDEPTATLPQHDAEALFEAVARMRDRGIAVIYVSHRLEEVLSLCDRVTVLRDGRKVADRDCADTDRSELVRLMVGREVADMYPERKARPGKVLLRTVGLRGPGSPHGCDLRGPRR